MIKQTDMPHHNYIWIVNNNEEIMKGLDMLSATDNYICAYILSIVDPTAIDAIDYTVPIIDFCRECDIHYDYDYDYDYDTDYFGLMDVLQDFYDKSFWITLSKKYKVNIKILDTIIIDRKLGEITFRLGTDMRRYVLGLIGTTPYEHISTLGLTSPYSYRLYNLLRPYIGLQKYVIKISALQSLIGAMQCKDICVDVLQIACQEINQYTDIDIHWVPIRYGSTVTALSFDIRRSHN